MQSQGPHPDGDPPWSTTTRTRRACHRCAAAGSWNEDYSLSMEDRITSSVKEEAGESAAHRIVSAERPMFGFGGAQLIHRLDGRLLRPRRTNRKDGLRGRLLSGALSYRGPTRKFNLSPTRWGGASRLAAELRRPSGKM